MTIRTFHVSRAEAGQPLAALLRTRLQISWSQARQLVCSGNVRVGTAVCRRVTTCVRAGQSLHVRVDKHQHRPASRKRQPSEKTGRGRQPLEKVRLIHADKDIVVVDKPAGLTTMRHAHEAAEFGARGRRFLPPTLADLLPGLLHSQGKGRVIAVHRLDRDTSGLVVFARNPAAARHLGAQFREHTTERTYLALVRGHARAGRIETRLVNDRGDGRRGSSVRPGEGQNAVTHVRVVEELGNFTLVECRLETGRTHQVRIHLGERGNPICGERIYDRPLHGQPLSDESGARRLCLHAASLGIQHPVTGEPMKWESTLPQEMEKLRRRLRRG
jgi:23S rRNA pseudouridine1911/1915/1917 synthase